MNKQLLGSSYFRLILIGVLFLSLSLAGCGLSLGQAEEIRIGLITDRSGPFAETSGRAAIWAAELAVQQVNDNGGLEINGRKHKVVLFIKDDQNTEQAGIAAAQELINQENVMAFVGPQLSRIAIPVSEVAEAAHIPMVSPMSTALQTTIEKAYVFRVAFIDSFQGKVVSQFAIKNLQAQTAAVLYDITDDYSRGLAEIFRQEFEAAGGQVVAFESFTTDEQDFFGQLTTIRTSGADVLFLPNHPTEATKQGQQARWMGINATLLGSDAWNPQSMSQYPEFDGAFFSHHWHVDVANSEAQSFIELYRQAYDQPPTITAALTYDAFGLIFQAMQTQGEHGSEAIRDGLYSMGAYNGVSGMIQYRETGDPVKSAVILQIANGESAFYKLVNP